MRSVPTFISGHPDTGSGKVAGKASVSKTAIKERNDSALKVGGFHVRAFAIAYSTVTLWFVIERVKRECKGLSWWVWLYDVQWFWRVLLRTERSLLWHFLWPVRCPKCESGCQ